MVVGEVLAFKPGMVTMTTVSEPFDPILWILVICEGGVVSELCRCGVEFVSSCFKVVEVLWSLCQWWGYPSVLLKY